VYEVFGKDKPFLKPAARLCPVLVCAIEILRLSGGFLKQTELCLLSISCIAQNAYLG